MLIWVSTSTGMGDCLLNRHTVLFIIWQHHCAEADAYINAMWS